MAEEIRGRDFDTLLREHTEHRRFAERDLASLASSAKGA
jgi:hypothetical protein